MKTIALRFAENFAPPSGTIAAHKEIIKRRGSVWYGKLGIPVSKEIATEILEANEPRILLIQSGKQNRYWAYIDSIKRETPNLSLVPDYYRNQAEKFGCWFHIRKFETAARNVMSQCKVISSGKTLSFASRFSINPYFIIDYSGDE